MKHYFAVKDLAIQAFATPFLEHAPGGAIRSFQDEVNSTNEKSAIAAHPEDYELYTLGSYDDTTGTIVGTDPELIARGKDLIRSKT